MEAERDLIVGAVKVSPAWALLGMGPAEWAATLAALYSLCLIADFLFKKIKHWRAP